MYKMAYLIAQLVKNPPAMQETPVGFLGWEYLLEKTLESPLDTKEIKPSLRAQLVKNPPAMQETLVRFLGQEDPLEKEMTTHSNILAWEIP